MKVKYELINCIVEIPDDLFDACETEDDKNDVIADYISDFIGNHISWEIL